MFYYVLLKVILSLIKLMELIVIFKSLIKSNWGMFETLILVIKCLMF